MTIVPAQREDLPEALALLYDVAPEDRPAYLAHAFRLMARGELDPADFWLARSQGRLLGVMALREIRGGVGIVWPPRTNPVGQRDIEDELITTALAHLHSATILQTFLPPEQLPLADPLLRHGFQHVTNVLHMEHPGGVIAPPSVLELQSGPDVNSSSYQQLLMRCHEDSWDCPELNHRRSIQDLLAGYQETSPDLHDWKIIRWHGEPVGTVILSGNEVSFLGLVPPFRGQGIGTELIRQVLDHMGKPCRLIVDERNIPARRMYDRVGFEVIDLRHVLLWFTPD